MRCSFPRRAAGASIRQRHKSRQVTDGAYQVTRRRQEAASSSELRDKPCSVDINPQAEEPLRYQRVGTVLMSRVLAVGVPSLSGHTCQDWGARTPLLHALLRSQVQTSLALLDTARLKGCVEQLVEPSVSGTDVGLLSGESPLHVACTNGLHRVAKAILSAGAKIERRDGTGASSLLCACRKVNGVLSRNMKANISISPPWLSLENNLLAL